MTMIPNTQNNKIIRHGFFFLSPPSTRVDNSNERSILKSKEVGDLIVDLKTHSNARQRHQKNLAAEDKSLIR